MHYADSLSRKLAHVLWIGGPPDSGKSTVAYMLGEKYNLTVYHFDRQEMNHINRADPARHPRLFELGWRLRHLDEHTQAETGWVELTAEEMAENATATWIERVSLAVEDVLALPCDRPVVAEGPGFYPHAILPLLTDPHQAICLVHTEAFKRDSHSRRGKGLPRAALVTDPDRAQRNHIERDLLMGKLYRRSARYLGIPVVEVGGYKSEAEVLLDVENWFAPRLAG